MRQCFDQCQPNVLSSIWHVVQVLCRYKRHTCVQMSLLYVLLIALQDPLLAPQQLAIPLHQSFCHTLQGRGWKLGCLPQDIPPKRALPVTTLQAQPD